MTRSFTLSRRRLLQTGLGAVSVIAGLGPLPRTGVAGPAVRARSLITLWMRGGASHLDTFDPKPGTPEAGPFGTVDTKVPGLRMCEHLPQLAKRADKLAVVRGLTSTEGDHGRAEVFLRTGHPPMAATVYPGPGAVLSKERTGADVPPLKAVSLLAAATAGGFLGAEHAPLLVVDPANPLDGWFPDRVAPEVLSRRAAALETLERATTADAVAPGRLEKEHRRVSAVAREFLGSPLVTALDVEQESDKIRDAYGRTPFGSACLLARRLVQAGVPFVEVVLDGWDSHVENFQTHQKLLATLDPAYANLLDDLGARGLLDSTLVLWMTEFGRTPVINPQRGRDHHPQAFSAVLSGGPVRGGQIVGKTDAQGNEVVERPVKVPDLIASVYSALGVDPAHSYVTPDGRPVKLLDGATPIRELTSL